MKGLALECQHTSLPQEEACSRCLNFSAIRKSFGPPTPGSQSLHNHRAPTTACTRVYLHRCAGNGTLTTQPRPRRYVSPGAIETAQRTIKPSGHIESSWSV